MDCFVASAFRLRSASFGGRGRSLSYGGQVAPRNDVKSKYDSAISRRDGPEFCKICFAALENRGRGECRVPNAPIASRAK
jgi:hypothetical protein